MTKLRITILACIILIFILVKLTLPTFISPVTPETGTGIDNTDNRDKINHSDYLDSTDNLDEVTTPELSNTENNTDTPNPNDIQTDPAYKDQHPKLGSLQISPLWFDQETVWGTVELSVTATDDLGINKVEFYSQNGEYLINSDTSAPYTARWVTDPAIPDGYQTIKVVAYDTRGQSTEISRRVYLQNDQTAPTTPTDLQSTGQTDGAISLSWSPASDNIGVVEYEIYNDTLRIGTATTHSITLHGLQPDTTYSLSVKARDRAYNFSNISPAITVTTKSRIDKEAPTAPTNLIATHQTDTQVSLEWNRAKDNYGVTGYSIYHGSTLLKSTSGRSTTLSGLVPDTYYQLTVKAKDGAGHLSPASNSIKIKTGQADTQRPNAPWNLTSPTQTKQTITLAWQAPEDNYGVSRYHIYQNGEQITQTKGTNFVVMGLTPETEYRFYVTALDSAGNESQASNQIHIKTGLTVGQAPSEKVIGYYAGWSSYQGYSVYDLDPNKLTHINYAFADIGVDLRIKLGDPATDLANFQGLREIKRYFPHLKTLISVGGWTWSKRFSDVALNETNRQNFADSLVEFIIEHGFDGIDLDWEFPVSGGMASNVNRMVDGWNYNLLLKTIRERLDAQSKIDGKDYLLTIAAGANKSFAKNVNLHVIQQNLDWISLMSYDLRGPWDSTTGFNAALYGNPVDPWSVSDAVQHFIHEGVPAEKLVMGLPFYGYKFKDVVDANNGLYQGYGGQTLSLPYALINKRYLNKGYTRYWHHDSKVPWLWDGTNLISYDDIHSIAEKAQYIREQNLGGAMIWELSQDPDEHLLDALNIGLE